MSVIIDNYRRIGPIFQHGEQLPTHPGSCPTTWAHPSSRPCCAGATPCRAYSVGASGANHPRWSWPLRDSWSLCVRAWLTGRSWTQHPHAIFSGFAAAFLASLVWMAAITKFDLSHAYPFMSLNFVVVLLLSGWLLNEEPVTLQKVLGIALIVLGTVVAARG